MKPVFDSRTFASSISEAQGSKDEELTGTADTPFAKPREWWYR